MPQLHILLCICKGCPILKSGPFKQTLPVGVCVCVCVKAWMVLGTFLSTSKFFLGGSDCLPGVFVQDDNVDWTWLDNPEVQISIHFHLLGTNAPGSYIHHTRQYDFTMMIL